MAILFSLPHSTRDGCNKIKVRHRVIPETPTYIVRITIRHFGVIRDLPFLAWLSGIFRVSGEVGSVMCTLTRIRTHQQVSDGSSRISREHVRFYWDHSVAFRDTFSFELPSPLTRSLLESHFWAGRSRINLILFPKFHNPNGVFRDDCYDISKYNFL